MPTKQPSLRAPFAHYYQNIPVTMMLGQVIRNATKDDTKSELKSYEELCEVILAMKSPIEFINSEPTVPNFEDLPSAVQKKIRAVEKSFKDARRIISSQETLLDGDKTARLAFYDRFDIIYDEFRNKLSTLE